MHSRRVTPKLTSITRCQVFSSTEGAGPSWPSNATPAAFTRSLAQQLGPEGIRCNTICPGAILTPMVEPLYAENPRRRESMERRTPLGRLGTPTDIAAAAAFLLSEEASFITGADLVVDGGWTIQTV